MDGSTWYLGGLIALALWYFITSFIIQPYLVLRKVTAELKEGVFRQLLTDYMMQVMLQPIKVPVEVKDETTGEKKVVMYDTTLMHTVINEGFEIAWEKGMQKINGMKSGMSRKFGDVPQDLSAAAFFLPKKLQPLAPFIMQYLSRANPQTPSTGGSPAPAAPQNKGKNTFI